MVKEDEEEEESTLTSSSASCQLSNPTSSESSTYQFISIPFPFLSTNLLGIMFSLLCYVRRNLISFHFTVMVMSLLHVVVIFISHLTLSTQTPWACLIQTI